MKIQKSRMQVLGVIVLVTMLLSLVSPVRTVLADDTPPPADTSEVVDAPVEEEAVPEDETPTVEEAVTEEAVVVESVSEGPADEEPVATEEAVTDAQAMEALPTDEVTVESDSVLLDQLPENTDVVVLDEQGETVPLASQEAVDIVKTGDPMWCPANVTPGGTGCTGSYTSLQALITYLDSNEQNQDGVIWIENTYVSSVNDPTVTSFDISGNTFTTMRNRSLTIQGGWIGSGTTINGVSNFGVPLNITNWNRDVTVNDIFISGATGTGLTVSTSRNIVLNHVTVNETTGNPGDGARLTTGNGRSATVNDSSFSKNTGYGIYASGGSLTLNNVTFSDNENGAYSYSGTLTCTGTTTQSCTTSVGTGTQTCSNGSWGTCVVDTCINGATNPPTCDVFPACENGATNPPTCDVFPACENGATNPPTCDLFPACENGATNPPTCDVFPACENGATNPPTCDVFPIIACPFGLTLVGNVCVDATTDGAGSSTSTDFTLQLIPLTGGQPTELSCTTSTSFLRVAGFEVTFAGLCGYSTLLDATSEGSLIAALPAGNAFVAGINVTLLQDGVPVSEGPAGASITLSFDLPAGMTGETLALLYWDPTGNGGAGGWIELETTVENGQAVVLLTPGTAVNFPASFALVDKNAEGAQVPSAFAWVNDFYVTVTQWFESLDW